VPGGYRTLRSPLQAGWALRHAEALGYDVPTQVCCTPASIYQGRARQPGAETQRWKLSSSIWRLNQQHFPLLEENRSFDCGGLLLISNARIKEKNECAEGQELVIKLKQD